jgi:hypothetical protein
LNFNKILAVGMLACNVGCAFGSVSTWQGSGAASHLIFPPLELGRPHTEACNISLVSLRDLRESKADKMIEIFRRDHGLRRPNDILLGWPSLLPYGLTDDFHEFAALL